MIPLRWHVYIVDLEPRVGTKPGKQRPCLSIQPTEFSQAGLKSTVIMPLTTRITREEAFPLRVRIPKGTCGLSADSDLLIDQLLAWDNSLFVKELGILPEACIERTIQALRDFLDF